MEYPFNLNFVYTGDSKNYEVNVDYNKSIIKLGYNNEEELYEQLRFDVLFSSDLTETLQLIVHKDFTTSTGKIQKSSEMRRINIIGEEFRQYSTAFSQIRCLVINSIFQNLVIGNPDAKIFHPVTGEVIV